MSASESRSGLVLELAEEFLERYRKGQCPSLKEYIDRHPSLADEIREVFPAMAMMENIALADGSLAGDPTGPAPRAMAARPERLGDFRILREVGHGGMGVVYEAEQVSLGRHVALKALPPQMLRDERQRRRFEREARAAARLHHTNIVPVFGVGEHDGTPYYVMQFIQGLSLDVVLDELKVLQGGGGVRPAGLVGDRTRAAWSDVSAADVAHSLLTGRFGTAPAADLATGTGTPRTVTSDAPPTTVADPAPAPAPAPGPPSSDPSSPSSATLIGAGAASDSRASRPRRPTYWHGVARIGVQVADALEYAHKQGIVHRDVKPSNLLLDARGTVWVADFGLAKADDQQNLTHTGDLLGTLRYMPPEAFEGKTDHRGDVYSLGLTLYELLAFRPAFGEKDRGRLVRQVTTEEPPRLGSLNPAVPRDLETIVHKAIDRDPARRYATSADLAADLQRFLDDEPIRARRTSAAERFARWCRHHQGIAGLAAALLLLMILTTAGSLAAAGRMSRLAEQEARAARAADRARHQETEHRRLAERARRQAEESLKEANAQRERAEAHFAMARRAVDDSFTKVSESRLLDVPGLQPLRLDLLQSALPFYEELIKKGAGDPSLRADLLTTRQRLGELLIQVGRPAEARPVLEGALTGYEQASRESPGDVALKAGMGRVLYWLSLIDGGEDRLRRLRKVVALREEIVAAWPASARDKAELADALNSLAISLSRRSPRDRATGLEMLAAYQRCAELRIELAGARPDDPDILAGLSAILNNIAVHLDPSANHAGRLSLLEQAISFKEAAFLLRPHDITTGHSLCIERGNLASNLWALGRRDESVREQRRAVEIARALARDNPDMAGLPAFFLNTSTDLARYLRLLHRGDEAVRVLLQARGAIELLPRTGAAELYEVARRRALFAQGIEGAKPNLSSAEKLEQDDLLEGVRSGLEAAVKAGWKDFKRLGREAPWPWLWNHHPDFRNLFDRLEAEAHTVAAPARPPSAPVAVEATPGGPADQEGGRGHADRAGDLRAHLAAIRLALGEVRAGLGDVDPAMAAIRQALADRSALADERPDDARLWSDLAATYVTLARVCRSADRPAEAVEACREGWPAADRAVALGPDDPEVRQERAFMAVVLGRLDQAAADYARSMDLLPRRRVPVPEQDLSAPTGPGDPTGFYAEVARDEALFDRVVRLRPDDRALLIARGRHLAASGSWHDTARVYEKLVELDPGRVTFWGPLAIVLARIGDAEGYRHACREMINRLGGTDEYDVAKRLGFAVLLRADSGVDREHTARLVTLALAKAPPPPAAVDRFLLAGLLDYREGRFEACVQRLSRLRWPLNHLLEAQRNVVLAMACQRLGKAAEARSHLEDAASAAAKTLGHTEREVPNISSWPVWLRYRILRREADAMTLDADFPADPFAP